MILFTRCEKWNTSVDVNNRLVLQHLEKLLSMKKDGNVRAFGG